MFGFVPLPALQMGAAIGIVVGYIAATEGAKRWFYRSPVRRKAHG
jgi:hypothetical protein